MDVMRKIATLCRTKQLVLQPEYIRSEDNIMPDFLSRMTSQSDWMLSASCFHLLNTTLGPLQIDRFATAENKQCREFNSWYHSPGSRGDALAESWRGVKNFCNPPFALLPTTIRKIITEGAEAVVIAPNWPSAPWFPLLRHAFLHKMSLTQTRQCVVQTNPTTPEPLRNDKWTLLIAYFPATSGTDISSWRGNY
jgi:hypothetical protein